MNSARAFPILIILLSLFGGSHSRAREVSDLDVSRSPAKRLETPLSVAVVSGDEFRPAQPSLGLDEALDRVPGVWVQQSGNFAQDTRVSIRGYGARSAFGIRGIRVLVDGIPTTLPDGQSELDSIELGFVDQIEVLRGPSSSLYGAEGGGVLALKTVGPSDRPALRARTLFGSGHLSRHQVLGTGRYRHTGYVIGIATTRNGGYRDHSRAEHQTLLTKFEHTLQDGTWLEFQFAGVHAPEAQDSGSVTAFVRDMDRRAARGSARSFDAGESVDQHKFAMRIHRPLANEREVNISAYYLGRDFENKLPFNRQVDLNRSVYGASIIASGEVAATPWTLGFEFDEQSDDRRNFENISGARGAMTLDQREEVRSYGVFARAEHEIYNDFRVVAGIRYDSKRFQLRDQFFTDGKDSTDRLRFNEWSPRVGLIWTPHACFNLYANWSTAFQVPTLTELRPASGNGGFDADIKPERTSGFELGIKGIFANRIVYDVAAFHLNIRNGLVPFTDGVGDTFFTNAGRVQRRGLEFGASVEVIPGTTIRSAYTFSDFKFVDFDRLRAMTLADLDGKREPNIPQHHVFIELRSELENGFFGAINLTHASRSELNDENNASSSGFFRSDIRAGYRARIRQGTLAPFIGIRNWSGTSYDGSLRPNDANFRYFEPAPQREIYGGLEFEWGGDTTR